ncbi:MAG: hypothetical protein EAZ57_08740 [Cytophagales bacterium]|nr:MAG: hypothetical protein EAZ67_09550 [Cytophagales bacterium]TAF60112.1 MAG: hypothetical protein EAZ57_08740 [Cytophagales bacterium]
MKGFYSILLLLLLAIGITPRASAQGTTTATLSGTVIDKAGETLPGATVLAVHEPTGSRFGVLTGSDGGFYIPNMNVGGPYTVTVSFTGYETQKKSDVYMSLGQNLKLNFDLAEQATELDGVVVTYKREIMDGTQTGATTVIDEKSISSLPTVSRDLNDFARLTPQAKITDRGGLSIAGMNQRFNSIFIDGAVNNDVFGLSDQGTNGGQTGISPISVDAIEQMQVVIAPYDVKLGGFAGGGINAVTRSGSNKLEGSAYYLFRNEGLAGKTPTDLEDFERKSLANFSSQTYGFRLGGPIIKNKLFFFVNAEIQNDETPQPFDFNTYNPGDSIAGRAKRADVDKLISTLKDKYNYDPGIFDNNTRSLEGQKFLIRLDYNLSDKHKLSFRHSYTRGVATLPLASNANTLNFTNNGQFFPSTTNSSALELKSNFGSKASNNLILGFTRVVDDRDPLGKDFPSIIINEGNRGSIRVGSEAFSSANQLKQSVFTLTNNFNLYKGRHTLTFGTHNEFYQIYNLFIGQNYGEYVYNRLSDFQNGRPANEFNRSFSLVDGVTGDGSDAAAKFSAAQLGLYVQDEFQVNDKLKLTAGVRLDMPMFFSQPEEDKYFNDSTIAKIEAAGYDMFDAKSGQMPTVQLMFAPRIGFNYDVKGDGTLQIRGGVGLFTSRVPFVWPAGMYTNNGLTIGRAQRLLRNAKTAADSSNLVFDPATNRFDPDLSSAVRSSGQMDLFAKNFKYPQVLRASIAADYKLPWDVVATAELIYTKVLNNVLYYNYNIKPSTKNLGGDSIADSRPLFNRGDLIDRRYQGIYVGTNTNEGSTLNFTASLQKTFDNGFFASLAYTFGNAMSIYDGTSSQNSSQWRGVNSIDGRNNVPNGISDFDLGHRVVGAISYRLAYAKYFATTISLFYTGQSGDRFSYIYNDNGNLTNEDSRERSLIWVPESKDQIRFSKLSGGKVVLLTESESDAMWNELNAFIENDKYLKGRRGDYAERNGARLPFVSIMDLRLLQDFYVTVNEKKHTLQLSFDVFNFTNMLNKDWGRRYFAQDGQVELIDFVGFVPGSTKSVPTYSFKKPVTDPWAIDDSGTTSSRWQAQLGVRYTF